MTYTPAHQQRAQYQRQQILTAPKEKLVQLLFDGIVRFSEQARQAFVAEPIRLEEGCQAVLRAQAIVMELLYTIDRENGGEVAENLARLHAYAFRCLTAANFERNPKKLEEVQEIYRSLSEAWIGAMGQLRESEAAPTPAAPAPAARQNIPTPAPAPTPSPVVPAAARPAVAAPISQPARPAPVYAPAAAAKAVAAAPAALTAGTGAYRPQPGLARPVAAPTLAAAPAPVPAAAMAEEAAPAAFEREGEALTQQVQALRSTLPGGGAAQPGLLAPSRPAMMATTYAGLQRQSMAAAYRAAAPAAAN